jgi:putative SOS response-associated peptidase YedK
MCNLYGMTGGSQEIRDLAKFSRDLTSNLQPLPAIFPDMMAPVVRTAPDGVRELVMMRWGFPPPPFSARRPTTNVRNTDSGYWKPYLIKKAHRCLVPVTSFADPDNYHHQGTSSIWTWFAQDECRPIMFFAGIWREWEGTHGIKADPAQGKHLLFSILTTEARREVAPIHSGSPVCLLDEESRERWMTAPWDFAREL